MTGPRRFNSLVAADRLVKSSFCVTFALLPPTVWHCTVLLQYTLPLNNLTVRPCHCIQYTLPPTCSTVVTPPMLLTALYCPDTVHAASIIFWSCIVYSTRCLLTALYCPATVHAASVYFGLVLSTVHAAY